MTHTADLIRRLENSSGADDELEALIWAMHNGETLIWCNPDNSGIEEVRIQKEGRLCDHLIGRSFPDGTFELSMPWRVKIPRYLSSVDACLALLEEALPEWEYRIVRRPKSDREEYSDVELIGPPQGYARASGIGMPLPNALLIAALRALEAVGCVK